MSSRLLNVYKNVFVAGLGILIPAILTFISRKVFLEYLSLELLGISTTFNSILGTLSLTELGFQSAILYNLYKPICANNKREINSLINILRIIFNIIGFLFIIIPICLCPFIQYFLNGTEVTITIKAYFLLTALASSVSYFLSYKRCLITADQKAYITKGIDLFVQVLFVILQIFVIIYLKSFALFLCANICKNILSNILIHIHCNKAYPYLHKETFDKILFIKLWKDTRNIFISKLAGVVYSAIDNILISSYISTIAVGSLANYTTITILLKTSCYKLFPIAPIIGNMLAIDSNKREYNEMIFRSYTFVKFIISSLIIIPMLILIKDFIVIWLGDEFILPSVIPYLLAIDMYIFMLTNPHGDFIEASGLFDNDRKIAVKGVIVNVIISIILVIPLGIPGVLIGTIASQIVFWLLRTNLVYSHCFHSRNKKNNLLLYWKKQMIFSVYIIFSYIILNTLYVRINHTVNMVTLVIIAIVMCIILSLLSILAFYRSPEFRFIYNKLKK